MSDTDSAATHVDEPSGLRALWWEWLVARVLLVLGFGLPLVVFLFLRFFTSAGSLMSAPSPAEQAAQERQQAGEQFCVSAVGVAQTYGIVPAFAKSTGLPQRTDVRGRYVCVAATAAAKYTVAVDLMCQRLTDTRCFNLFSVTQDNGGVLFQRQS